MKNSVKRRTFSRKSIDLASNVSSNRMNPDNSKYVLQRFLEEEEKYDNVYAVREDLMHAVMGECYKKYLEKQCVKFIVHCSYKALLKLIDLNFYVHNPVWAQFKDHPDWSADAPPEPSAPDTWAAFNVPKTEPKKLETVSSMLSSPESTSVTESDVEISVTDYLHEYLSRYDSDLVCPEVENDLALSTPKEPSLESTHSLSAFSQIKFAGRNMLPGLHQVVAEFPSVSKRKSQSYMNYMNKLETMSRIQSKISNSRFNPIKLFDLVPLRAQLRCKFLTDPKTDTKSSRSKESSLFGKSTHQ